MPCTNLDRYLCRFAGLNCSPGPRQDQEKSSGMLPPASWRRQRGSHPENGLKPLQRRHILARRNKLRPRLQALLRRLQAVLDTVVDAEQIGPRIR